jgi:hypothetical protein
MLAWNGTSILLAAAVATVAPATTSLTPADARRSLIGRWEGTLEYRDYQADRWFGLPVKVEVRDGEDGVTLIRTADYDDGPTTGNVRITTVTILADNGTEETAATFRKGRAVELDTAKLSLNAASTKDNWTMIETSSGRDDDRPATLRLTTTRSGTKLVTLKEVDFSDDSKAEWLVRNRTTLEKR